MDTLLEIIHITLTAISKAVYNYWFLIVVGIVYFLAKKIRSTNVYNIENAKSPSASLIEAVLQGIVVGIVGSLIIVILGLPVELSSYLMFLLPISLVLSLINIRYICFSYSASLLGVLALTFNGQTVFGIVLPDIAISISGLLALVGILHLMESLLIYFVGADDCMPIVSKKDGRIVQGHILQKYWPIPIAVLFATTGVASGDTVAMPDWWPLLKTPQLITGAFYLGLMPFVGVLGYSSVTFAEEPERRAKKTGRLLFGYSILLIGFSIFMGENFVLSLIGLVLMSVMHEGIILLEQHHERQKDPLYTLPEQGVRIMHVIQGGVAEKAGIRKGNIIRKINDLDIINAQHFREVMEKKLTFLWIETENFKREITTHEIKAYPVGLETLDMKILPENPRVLFKYENLSKVGILHMLRKRYGGKGRD
ncbi:MAG: PDZ domain-containing protein [Vallitaleaceae bacterium]|nr:PDZ domain-containing protein [Vallitaleaceae bacterium]